MNKIAIFASGSGTNAQKIMEFFQHSSSINVSLIISDNKNAGVLNRAIKFNVPSLIIGNTALKNPFKLIEILKNKKITLIVLSGFLLKIPKELINQFPNKIINIHPALLPKYGGKGMYGNHVHQAIIQNKEKESGITIHYVNENYDEGAIIFQAKCKVLKKDTPELLATKIHQLEHQYFASTINKLLKNEI